MEDVELITAQNHENRRAAEQAVRTGRAIGYMGVGAAGTLLVLNIMIGCAGGIAFAVAVGLASGGILAMMRMQDD